MVFLLLGATAALPVSAQQGECRVERVAAEEGVNQFQYDGLSPDGRTLAVGWQRGETERGTFLLDLINGERAEIPQLDSGGSFTADGGTLVATLYAENGRPDIAEFDRQTERLRILTPHEASDWLPTASADGRSLLFNSFRTGGSDLYMLDRSTEQLRQLTDSPNYDAYAQLSPDGGTVAFHRRVGEADYNIILLDLASGVETTVTDSPREESYASWTPDGRHLFFASDRDAEPGKTDLFVMTRDGALLHKLTTHPEKDAYPFVSPDGRYLYFNSNREPRGVYRIALGDDLDCLDRVDESADGDVSNNMRAR